MRISDWSSDVCSSDLSLVCTSVTEKGLIDFRNINRERIMISRISRHSTAVFEAILIFYRSSLSGSIDHIPDAAVSVILFIQEGCAAVDRKSVVQGKSVHVRVDLGVSRILKKKNKIQT